MGWQDIEGWFSASDVQFVSNICSAIHDGVVVEVGFYAGKSTAAIAPGCRANNNVYHTIDNCYGSDTRDPATKNQQSRDMRSVFEKNMRRMDLFDYLNVHIMDSAEAADIFADGSVDFCFIDASHKEEHVSRDIEAWWPKVKSGGILGGHDWEWRSVRNAVKKFSELQRLQIVSSGNCWKLTK